VSKREQRDQNYRDVFRREHEILDEAEELLSSETVEEAALREGFDSLSTGFSRLLDNALKITRIGDSVQRQLVDTQRELRKTLREKEDLNHHLTEMAKEKDEYLGIAAHDLRSPLSNVIMGMELIQEQPDMGRGEWLGILKDSTEECRRILDLLGNLLDVNRIETGNMVWEKRDFCASVTALSVAEGFFKKASLKEQKIIFDEPSEDLFAHADPQVYVQILENLISNALKYSPTKSVTRIRLVVAGEYLRTEVEDEGPGISSEDRENLFKKFARLSARPTGGESTVGLGLSIVKGLAEAMNGRVGCRTRVGEGSVFYIDLPTQAH